jgi:hypothetical protein
LHHTIKQVLSVGTRRQGGLAKNPKIHHNFVVSLSALGARIDPVAVQTCEQRCVFVAANPSAEVVFGAENCAFRYNHIAGVELDCSDRRLQSSVNVVISIREDERCHH